ncbi:MAG: hypothetical protein K0Q71_6220 [Thermomicrobiales bacterium]|nr:hypothetical protein [Thermomicrobiales bacterium]
MNPTHYLSLAEVIAIHESAMRHLGDEPKPLRDEGSLESAVMRPQMAAYYEGADSVRQAARMNGLTYSGDRLALARQFEQFAERSHEPDEAIDAFETWLREYVQSRPERE